MNKPACISGACDQGRKPCPFPAACIVPLDEDDTLSMDPRWVIVIVLVAIGLGLLALIH